MRERIASEPAVAARWRRLCATMEALSELPDALPPPEHTSAQRPHAPRAVRTWLRPLMLAAAVLLWSAALLWSAQRGAPDLILASGESRVSGSLSLLAGDVPVDVDGVAWISVEPRVGGAPRGGCSELA